MKYILPKVQPLDSRRKPKAVIVMNTYQHVIVAANPLKTITIYSSIKKKTTTVKALIPDGYIDLKTGLWNISLDYVIATTNLQANPEKTIYEIKSSLVTNISYKNTTDYCTPESQFATLGQFELNFTNYFVYKKFDPLWFFVDQPHGAKFEIEINQNRLVELPAAIEFEIELGLLFQRIR
jgi:hypothetical protein